MDKQQKAAHQIKRVDNLEKIVKKLAERIKALESKPKKKTKTTN